MKKIFCSFCLGLLTSFPLLADNTDSLKTVELKEIRFVQQRGAFYAEDHHVISIKKEEIQALPSASVGDLLRYHFPSVIKSYGGPGSLSSVSLRGTASNHTQINWNGFPLNNATTGDADLSLFPLLMADKISIISGASGSLYGSGTFGGAIDISNDAGSPESFTLASTTETGSFGNLFNTIDMGAQIKSLRYQGILYRHNARNDFLYVDPVLSGLQKQSHNELHALGLFQQLNLSIGDHHVFSLVAWYQDRQKNLPGIMGSMPGSSFAVQADSSLKVFLKYGHSGSAGTLTLKTAYFSDYMRYTDKFREDSPYYKVYSVFQVKQFFTDISLRKNIGKKLILDGAIVSDQVLAHVPSYGKTIHEPRLSALLASKWTTPVFVINSSIRMERLPEGQLISLPSLGGLLHTGALSSVRLNLSKKLRQPTLNEKYWIPGGNPQIKPELGWGGELGWKWDYNSSVHSCEMDITAYSTHINNYILWTGEGIVLAPENVQRVWSRGMEASVADEIPIGKSKITVAANYTFTRSSAVANSLDSLSVNRQLRYVPLNAGNLNMEISHWLVDAGINYSVVGERAVSELPGSGKLPVYMLTDVWLAKAMEYKSCSVECRLQIFNLFNKEYQVVAFYPMPGRYFSLSLRLSYKHS